LQVLLERLCLKSVFIVKESGSGSVVFIATWVSLMLWYIVAK
jgi:hypothetical protein